MNKNNKQKVMSRINSLFCYPICSAMTGFGIFWYSRLLGYNVWFSMIVALYVSALISKAFSK